MELKNKIEFIIKDTVANPGTKTHYREPLIGFASTDDPIFIEIKHFVGPHQLHPKEIFPEAKTVIAFFLPFEKELVKQNLKSGVVKDSIQASVDTSYLIREINEKIKTELEKDGITAIVPKVIFDYKNSGFNVSWSHKSAAYAAGLGTFGFNQMLITQSGCAGRIGSILISAEIPPTLRPKEEFCRHKKGEQCLVCMERCQSGALNLSGFDKEKCFMRLHEEEKAYPELNQHGCGKCATGPCTLDPSELDQLEENK
jgi:epoxyqueuosine reductase QueG